MFGDRRGAASVELALVIPIILLLIGGVAEFAYAIWTRNVLATAVAQGGRYAMLAGANATSSNVRAVVRNSTQLAIPEQAVSVSAPTCFCVVAGRPPTLAPEQCKKTCADGRVAGTYISISASHTYSPIMGKLSPFGSRTFVEPAQVRID
ncbi:hypothetical protein GCM10011504_53680 [Siccirubricoccus deserti]|nr:hypothetical protein GCM10011504_53680 [Siccirubricoccus deserti]